MGRRLGEATAKQVVILFAQDSGGVGREDVLGGEDDERAAKDGRMVVDPNEARVVVVDRIGAEDNIGLAVDNDDISVAVDHHQLSAYDASGVVNPQSVGVPHRVAGRDTESEGCAPGAGDDGVMVGANMVAEGAERCGVGHARGAESDEL